MAPSLGFTKTTCSRDVFALFDGVMSITSPTWSPASASQEADSPTLGQHSGFHPSTESCSGFRERLDGAADASPADDAAERDSIPDTSPVSSLTASLAALAGIRTREESAELSRLSSSEHGPRRHSIDSAAAARLQQRRCLLWMSIWISSKPAIHKRRRTRLYRLLPSRLLLPPLRQ